MTNVIPGKLKLAEILTNSNCRSNRSNCKILKP